MLLRVCNIGPYMEKWIKILYTDICSILYINNRLTDEIEINRSVRQGCPLSMLLFVLCLEPLLRSINNDKNVKGFQALGRCFKYIAHADDVTFLCILENDIR